MKDLVKIDLSQLAEEIKDIYVESSFSSRWILVDGYHQIGNLILGAGDIYSAVKELARLTNISERMLYYAVKFAEKYPQLDHVPEGKAISWNKLVTKYLPENTKLVEGHEHEWVEVCKICRKRKTVPILGS